MVAAAFTQTLIFKGQNGQVIHLPMTVSDVAAAFALCPDLSDNIQLPGDQIYTLVDILVVTGGTDTNFQNVFINGMASSLKIANKANLTTANIRQFQSAPIPFAPGTRIKLVQSAA